MNKRHPIEPREASPSVKSLRNAVDGIRTDEDAPVRQDEPDAASQLTLNQAREALVHLCGLPSHIFKAAITILLSDTLYLSFAECTMAIVDDDRTRIAWIACPVCVDGRNHARS